MGLVERNLPIGLGVSESETKTKTATWFFRAYLDACQSDRDAEENTPDDLQPLPYHAGLGPVVVEPVKLEEDDPVQVIGETHRDDDDQDQARVYRPSGVKLPDEEGEETDRHGMVSLDQTGQETAKLVKKSY